MCGLVRDRVVEQVSVNEATTSRTNDEHVLQNDVVVMLPKLCHVIIQQDFPPRDYLNAIFPGRWIGRGGTNTWPPPHLSLDLTPLNLFSSGCFKDTLCRKQVSILDELQQMTADILTLFAFRAIVRLYSHESSKLQIKNK